MTKVLVTGATGALGKAVSDFLKNKDGYEVVTTSRSGVDTDFKLEITHSEQLSKIVNRVEPDLIMQMAATFTHDFEEAYAVNVEANRQLLEIVKCLKVRARVLLVGSAAEYGVIQPDENPISENHALNPVSVYGLTKAWQSQLATLYSWQGVDVVIARVFNLKGDNLSEKLFVGRLQKQIDQVISGEKSVIELGAISATRDYISLEKATHQIISIAEYGRTGLVYNVASGIPQVVSALLIDILEKHNLDMSVVKVINAKNNRVGYDVPVIFADTNRILNLMKKRM